MAVYKMLISKSVGVYCDVEANSEDEAVDMFYNGEDCGEDYDEYDVESYVVEAKEKE